MNAERTLVLIKPDAIAHEQDAVYRITQAGFHIINVRIIESKRLYISRELQTVKDNFDKPMNVADECHVTAPISTLFNRKSGFD